MDLKIYKKQSSQGAFLFGEPYGAPLRIVASALWRQRSLRQFRHLFALFGDEDVLLQLTALRDVDVNAYQRKQHREQGQRKDPLTVFLEAEHGTK